VLAVREKEGMERRRQCSARARAPRSHSTGGPEPLTGVHARYPHARNSPLTRCWAALRSDARPLEVRTRASARGRAAREARCDEDARACVQLPRACMRMRAR